MTYFIMEVGNLLKIPGLIPVWGIMGLVLYISIRTKISSSGRPMRKSKEIIIFLLSIYMVALVAFLSPLSLSSGFLSLVRWREFLHPLYVNMMPFQTIFRYTPGSNVFYFNIFGNVLLFVPVGFLFSYVSLRAEWWRNALRCMFFSVLMELSQLASFRVSDVDDILLNTIGALIGIFLYHSVGIFFGIGTSDLNIDHLENMIDNVETG